MAMPNFLNAPPLKDREGEGPNMAGGYQSVREYS